MLLASLLSLASFASAEDAVSIPLNPDHAADWLMREGDWQFGDDQLEQRDESRMGVAFLKEPAYRDFELSAEFNIRTAV